MKGSQIITKILSTQVIPNADPMLLKQLKSRKGERSLGIITTDCDDASYVALDEATKMANVRVLYAKSMYAGSSNASTEFAGEFIGILASDNPSEVESGIASVIAYLKNDTCFYIANDSGSVSYFAHCISKTGSYLSRIANVSEGSSLAYLIAPPQEALCGIDAAIKAADTQLKVFYGPPTETNFAGGILCGNQSACLAACQAFSDEVCRIAEAPIVI
jgi:ethanolamine utilization protein EutL